MKNRLRKIKIPAKAAKSVERKFFFLIIAGVSFILIVIATAYIFLSSSGNGSGEQSAPGSLLTARLQNSQVLTLSPAEATKSSLVRLSLNGLEPSTTKFEWIIDGTPVTPPEPMTMSLSEEAWAKKGSVIKVRAVAGDQEYLSNEVVIKNSPVKVTGLGFANQSNSNDPLIVTAEAHDLDGDEIRYEYAWIVNGAPAGTTDRLDIKVKRGDRITAQVTACDGEGGCSSRSAERTISNMPPVIAENKSYRFENNMFEYQVTASDPDGDPLEYTLQSSPPGSQIDSSNGSIRWQAPQDASGKQRFSIAVTDGQGGRSTHDLDFTP